MNARPETLASAWSLPEIRESIARFYAGCAKGIAPCMRDSDVPANECQWAIVWPDGSAKQGQALPGVRLISKRGRFLFQMV